VKVVHRQLVAAIEEDLPLELRLRAPCTKKRLEVDDVDLPLDEPPHEPVRIRGGWDGSEQVRVVQT